MQWFVWPSVFSEHKQDIDIADGRWEVVLSREVAEDCEEFRREKEREEWVDKASGGKGGVGAEEQESKEEKA